MCSCVAEGFKKIYPDVHGKWLQIRQDQTDGLLVDIYETNTALEKVSVLLFHALPDSQRLTYWTQRTSYKLPMLAPSVNDIAKFIKSRRQSCLAEHRNTNTDAHNPASFGSRPARLVSVGNATTPPFLVETKSLENMESIQYIALSHCWGAKQPIRTLKRTKSSFEKSISWTALPQTFKDAMTISQALGIRYIWIDSLCIIQDDPEDWVLESSKMASVYRNSYVTIAAAIATNSEMGFLHDRTVVKLRRTIGSDESPYTIFVRQNTPKWEFERPHKEQNLAPLLSRGWVLQEEILSQHIIYFTREELVWQCHGNLSCECSCVQVVEPVSRLLSKGLSLTTWAYIVENFTARKITYPKDRLPALSGIATFLGEGKGRYIAGIWEEHLPYALLWSCVRRGRRIRLPRSAAIESNPPSWSWASIEAPSGVIFHGGKVNSKYAITEFFRGTRDIIYSDDARSYGHGIWRPDTFKHTNIGSMS